MPQQLFVQNVTPSVDTEELHSIFANYGEILDIQRPLNPDNEKPQKFAFIVMQTEESAQAAIKNLTGYKLAGQELIVKLAEPKPLPAEKLKEKFSPEERQANEELAERVAAALNETDTRPRVQILRLIEEMGEAFVEELYNDTLQVYEEGGMMTNDGGRSRSLGGVFFKLAKDRLDGPTRAAIFPSWRQLREKKKGDGNANKNNKGAAKGRGGRGNAGGAKGGGPRGKGKGKPRATQTPPPQSKIAMKKRPAPEPEPKPEVTPEVVEKYKALKSAEAEAQKRLADIKAKRIAGSPLEALKEVAELKSQLAQLTKTYPDLKKP